MFSNPELELALNFVEKTDRNIFLSGKAGTGKTTFLHKIKNESLKRLVVVAPTGVAAINAKGVTIHSFFQMPFGPIIPGISQNKSNSFKHKFSKTKIDIIRSLDLLIIDEISMVRADLLDGIDQVLRRYKNRNKVFGGVQVLMIGDLQQLSPVVKPNEWELLRSHYDTSYFFSSKSFIESNTIGIELKHIYRQDNEEFISILNQIRNDNLTPKSADTLNQRYQPDFIPTKDEGYITLTTHNDRANRMNEQELNKLKSKGQTYKAEIKGKFNEYSYPTHEKLELKVGAQVMFIKNDSNPEKRYFNGKIGTITYLDKNSVLVKCPEDDDEIETNFELWENISYTINQETKEISENIAGSFSQIPLRLAWAITIHKSQGLTFEKAIIDAEASFAHGQTYVALSRCKTLEGIVLKSQIKNDCIIRDNRVASFTQNVEDNLPNQSDLNNSQKEYQLNLIEELFNYHNFLYPVRRLSDIYYQNRTSFNGNIIGPLEIVKDKGIIELLKVSTRFKNQLTTLSENIVNPEKDDSIQERIKKAITYFINHTNNYIKKPLDEVTFSTDNKAVKKDFTKQINLIEEQLSIKLFCLNGLVDGFRIKKYLELRAKSVLQKSTISKKEKDYNETTVHPLLFSELRLLRNDFAQAEDVHHFQVFTQKSLFEMCEFLPTTSNQLRAINGMGKVRVKNYGEKILEVITNYCDKNEIEKGKDKSVVPKTIRPKIGETQKITYELFKDGLTIFEIAKKRGFVTSTIEGHLAQYILSGDIKVEEVMPKNKYLELKKIMKTTTYESFSELKEKIDDKFTYGEMRMVGMEMELAKNQVS